MVRKINTELPAELTTFIAIHEGIQRYELFRIDEQGRLYNSDLKIVSKSSQWLEENGYKYFINLDDITWRQT